MRGHLAWRAVLVAFTLAFFALPGVSAAAGRSAPSWPSGVARVSEQPSPPRIAVTVALASTAPAGTSTSLEVDYRATVSATCSSGAEHSRRCLVPDGTVTWQLDGASTSPGNLTVTTQLTRDCSRAVSAQRSSSSCVVSWPTYGDQWVTASYTSRPRPQMGGRLQASATTGVDLRAPLDLAAGRSFDPYGNTGPGALEDCTFATAADWIEATYATAPAPQAILASYRAAERAFDGGGDAGLAATQLFSYWQHVGIAGTTLTGEEAVPLSEVGSSLSGGHVLFATAELPAGFPGGHGQGGAHAWLVVGSSGYGPMIVTWGQELQISWADFDAWTTGLWAIDATTP